MRYLFVAALAFFASCAGAMADPNHGHGGGGGARPAPHAVSRPSVSRPHMSAARPSFSHGSAIHRPGVHRPAFGHHTPPRLIHIHGSTHHVYRHAPATHHVVRRVPRRGTHVAVRGRPASIVHLRRNFRSPHRYHFGAYRRPSGWYAHRWTYGQRLPRGWYGRDYWITDWSLFGLIAPPADYTWVRVGDDALLIDADTGEIIQVDYGVFY